VDVLRISPTEVRTLDLRTNPREPLEVMQKYPAFQGLLDKAETHELHFRPKEAQRLKDQGKLQEVLLSRTESCWNSLSDCLRNGMHLNEAEEIALPLILLPSEAEEEQEELERRERMHWSGEGN
jgi:hypothetical protein